MQSQRETQTDSLASIIQILQLGYRSGTLTIERNTGLTIEEGYILFVNGRVVEAQTNTYSGMAAFNYLQTWGSCRFSFNVNGTNATSSSGSHASNHAGAPSLPGPLAPTNGYGKGGAHSPFPRRSQAGEATISHLESAPIQRIHRRLLLLINGQRNLTELARLMTRNPDEVQLLLDDLERTGLIQQ